MNQGNPDEEFEERLHHVRAQTAGPLSSLTEQKLVQLDEDLRTMLAKALVDSQRNAVKSTRDALDRAAHEAFRHGDGPRERWTLADWGHAWAWGVLLAEAGLRSEPGGNVGELLAFVRADDKRPGYLLAFLNETGDPVPRRLSEIAARVGETGSTRSEGPSEDDARGSTNDDDTQPKLNAVFNRLQTLTAYRLVKRAGPSAGLYELTRWGYKTARALQAEDLEKAVSSIADRSVLKFLACFGDAATATTPLEGAAIREKLRSEPRVEQPDRLSEQLLSLALGSRLIRRVDRHEDRYELTALGRKIAVEVREWRARALSGDATIRSIGPFDTLAGDYDGGEAQRNTKPFAHALRWGSTQPVVH